jgi:superfamily II DNA helicase RecQ
LLEKILLHGFEVEDKLQNKPNFKKNPQSSIIYVRNRKACIEISSQLQLALKQPFIMADLVQRKDKTCSFDARQSTSNCATNALNGYRQG